MSVPTTNITCYDCSEQGGSNYGDCFRIYGPFEIENRQKIVDREHQDPYWSECVDKEYEGLSLARGIYLFSLRNAENYNPQYVGMTTRDFRTEVFNDRNTVMIFKHFLEGGVCSACTFWQEPNLSKKDFL